MTSQQTGNTVFLTEQEVDRIRKVIVSGQQNASKIAGQSREPRDADSSIKAATGASLMADMSGGLGSEWQAGTRGHTLPVLTVGQTYPASTLSLEQLEPIQLADLKQETHHLGRKLAIRRVSPVVTLAARSWTMVQGEEGDDTERLEVVLHKLRYGEEVLEESKRFVIKEPYLTFNEDGETTLRISHPTDLVIVGDETVQSTSATAQDTTGPSQAIESSRKAKARGDAALKKQDHLLAHDEFTKALSALKSADGNNEVEDLTKGALRGRANASLALGLADSTISDAKAALLGHDDSDSKELDSQMYLVAARAAYSLKDLRLAKTFTEQSLSLTSGNNDASAFFNKVQARIKQQETGKYDLKKIRAGLSRSKPDVDAADFVRKTEIKDSGTGRGRGLFTTCDIPAGGIVMCEKAFCVVWGFRKKDALTAMTYDLRDERIRVAPVGLARAVVQKLLRAPSQRAAALDLYGQHVGDVPAGSATAEGPVVDAFRVHDIVARNAFGPGAQFGEGDDVRDASTGLWLRAAYTNHSCVPNTTKEYVGDLIVLRAGRALKAGEEIEHSYVDTALDVEARAHSLMDTWGFECGCALCGVQRAEDPAVRRKRKDLVAEAEQFLEREHWADAKRLTIVRAQRLVNGIEATFDGDGYKSIQGQQYLPSVVHMLRDWVTKASPRK